MRQKKLSALLFILSQVLFNGICDPLKLDKSAIASLSFADDLVILSSTHKGLQNSLNKLETYCYDWQLAINTAKTKVMIFQNIYTHTPHLFYKNCQLNETKEYRYLGSIIGDGPIVRRSDSPKMFPFQ